MMKFSKTKKRSNTARLSIACLCILFAAGMLAGCSSGSGEFQKSSYTADGTQVKEIQIQVRDREIEVALSQDQQISLEYAESEKEGYSISVSQDNVLTMAAKNNKNWTDYFGGKADAANRKILLRIPSGLLSSLTLSTTNGDLLLPALEVTGSLSLSANNGDIRFEKLGVGNALDLKAKNGDIRGTVAGSYEEFSISCESKKGESNLPSKKDGAPKALTVANNNGDITIEFAG